MKKLALSLLCLFAPLAHADAALTEANIRTEVPIVLAEMRERGPVLEIHRALDDAGRSEAVARTQAALDAAYLRWTELDA